MFLVNANIGTFSKPWTTHTGKDGSSRLPGGVTNLGLGRGCTGFLKTGRLEGLYMNISLPGLRSGILVNPDRPYKLGPSIGGGPVDMVWCGVVAVPVSKKKTLLLNTSAG